MPKHDETGPLGAGPRTGWGMGPCRASAGRNFRGWRGFGRFWGRRSMTKQEETNMLNYEAKLLEEELGDIKTRLAEIKK